MKVHYPQGISTGHSTFKHIHDKQKRPRDQKKYGNQWDVSGKRNNFYLKPLCILCRTCTECVLTLSNLIQ